MSALLRSVQQGTPEFEQAVRALARRGESDLERVDAAVEGILSDVRTQGDAALRRYITQFEKRSPEALLLTDYGGEQALASLAPAVRDALKSATERIRRYHERQATALESFGHGVPIVKTRKLLQTLL